MRLRGTINFVKSDPYNAVDFDQSKQMDRTGLRLCIKICWRHLTLLSEKEKIGYKYSLELGKGEFIEIQASKHPKHDNAPLVLTKSGIEFNHRRKIREVDEDRQRSPRSLGFCRFHGNLI